MTVDIRAKVICRIGDEEPEIISGGWSDDHAQGTGLIRTRGELIVRGLIRPTLGQQVDLAYIQHGIASRVPRALRVLGAFADPFRNQTTMQLGCALTLRENLAGVEPQDLTADTWNDPANSNIVCSEFEQVPISISAAYVASVCAQKLGINVPGGFPLTNWFTVAQFDLSPGYATVLSDLLVSESYIGYLDAAENLQIQSLLNFTGTTTVIDPTQVIDVSAINSGDIPGNAVSASYSYNRFKNQEEELTEEELELRDWTKDETVGPPSTITIKYGRTDSSGRQITPSAGVYTREVTPTTTVITTYDEFDRKVKQVETTKTHVANTNSSYIKWFSEQGTGTGGPIQDTDDYIIKTTTFKYEYEAEQLTEIPTPPPGSCAILYGVNKFFNPERDNNLVSTTEETRQSEMALAGALNIAEYSGTVTTPAGGSSNWYYHPPLETNIVTEVVVTEYERDIETGITKSIVTRQQAQAFTQAGQQVGAAEAQDALANASLADVVEHGMALINLGTVVQTRTDRQFGLQRRPGRSARQANYQRKSQLESFSDIVFVTGNVTSGSITRYSVPYSSDDRITGLGGLSPSDAPVKAAAYARAQNRLAFGHRNGFSIQLAAPDIPTYPLDRLMVSAADTAAAYVCNGTSWSFDSNGIVCNTDALFIGGVGTTETGGSLWFPVQPGITLLGPAPEVYENEYPQPANSVEVGEEFDPLDPPPTFWDEDLPTDTPAIPAFETEIDVLVPPWREEILNTFAARTTIDVSRTYPNIPTIQPVALVTKAAISVKAVPLRTVVIPVFTESSVEELGAAIRAEPVEMFTMFSFGAFVF